MNTPIISVCCVSLDNPKYVDLLIRGLKRNTVRSFEVLLYINDIGAGWTEVLQKHIDVISVYMKSPFNLGYAKPVNSLLREAHGEFVCFMDDDFYPCPEWDSAVLSKYNVAIPYQYLCPSIIGSPKTPSECLGGPICGYHYSIFDYGTIVETFREDEFNNTWNEVRVRKDTSYPTGGWFITRDLQRKLGDFEGSEMSLMYKLYNRGIIENQPVEFRTVADFTIYHFGHIGKSKPNAFEEHGYGDYDSNRTTWDNILALKLPEDKV